MESDLELLVEKSLTLDEFLSDSQALSCIDFCKKNPTSATYKLLIKAIVDSSELPNKKLLVDLFSNSSILTISSYRKLLRYRGREEWDKYRLKNDQLYNNLSARICNYLVRHSLADTLLEFQSELQQISNLTNKRFSFLESVLSKYKNAYQSKDRIALSTASSNMKSLIKSFNAKAKEKYIQTYVTEHISEIKSRFSLGIEEKPIKTKITIPHYLAIIIQNDQLRNTLRVYIEKTFGYTVDNKELRNIITNILSADDKKNLEFFQIENPPRLLLLKPTKAYNRLVFNYLPQINSDFHISNIDDINAYLNETDVLKRKSLRGKFSEAQLLLLEQIKPILKEASAVLALNDDKFAVSSDLDILDLEEEREMKMCAAALEDYRILCALIKRSYYSQCKAFSNMIEESKVTIDYGNVPFTDDNYYLNNLDYLFNFEVIVDILKKIHPDKIAKYSREDEYYRNLHNLLCNEGLLACALADGNMNDVLVNIINNTPSIYKGSLKNDFNMNRLTDISKKAELLQFIDDFTLSLLGEEVAEKIVYNFQFLQGKNTPDKISERLSKAVDLMIRSQDINKSAIPYFEPIEVDGIKLERYRNNDSDILTSGIDSNTCFKISANDNDYLFYSILNKNGMVCRILEDDQMIGRITAHRLSNVLMINGVRTIENDYQATSLEKLERNNSMIEAITQMAKQVIAITSESDCPIDFVVSNKAGILEAPEYNETFPILPEHLFNNPIDCYHEDFEEFKNTYKYEDEKQFLQEVPYHTKGVPFTTDFGHYPVVLISSRSGKSLDRLWDITTNSPEDIYQRPEQVVLFGTGELSEDSIKAIERINALGYAKTGNNLSDYHRGVYQNEDFELYEIGEDYYNLVDFNGDSKYHLVISKSTAPKIKKR